jgi:hypothetical protein
VTKNAAVLAALLTACLEDDLAFRRGRHDAPAFADGAGQWFLAVDMSPGPRGQHARQGVPMIGRGNHDGIEVISGQQFSKVPKAVTAFEVVVFAALF